jgi:dihydroorotate dehydrogenase (NAD+) catalytic subunit
MTRELATSLGALVLPNPVVVAAGCGGSGRELRPYADLTALGAFTTATLTPDPQPGHRPPRLAESPSGLITSLGLPNGGVDGFLLRDLPWLADRGIRTIVSIAGPDASGYAEVARRLDGVPGIAALELNLAGDHERIVGAVRQVSGLPLLAKLMPDGVVAAAEAAVRGGADGVTLVNGVPAMAIDPGSLRPVPAGPGALSGPAIHPIAVHAVYEVHASLPDLPIIGTGGVATGWDALELVLAGASAVGVGTALLHDPGAADRITAELADALETCHLPSLAAAIGRAHHDGPTHLREHIRDMETTG